MSLVAAQMYSSDDVEGLNRVEGLHNYFATAAANSKIRFVGRPRIDPKLMTRVSFASILACVIFKDWLFPKGLACREDISAAITAFVMDGLNANTRDACIIQRGAEPQRRCNQDQTRIPGHAQDRAQDLAVDRYRRGQSPSRRAQRWRFSTMRPGSFQKNIRIRWNSCFSS